MKKNYNKNFLIPIISLLFILIISVYFFTRDTQELTVNSNNFYLDNSAQKNEQIKIAIHIIGEVNSPGMLYLDTNSRIADAISAADGLTDIADLNKVNLAYELKDGQKIYIPSIYDEDISNYITDSAGDNVLDNSTEYNKEIININLATQNELESLPGIGKSTANKIIEYRAKNGKFKTIEDLMNVSRNWRKQI